MAICDLETQAVQITLHSSCIHPLHITGTANYYYHYCYLFYSVQRKWFLEAIFTILNYE